MTRLRAGVPPLVSSWGSKQARCSATAQARQQVWEVTVSSDQAVAPLRSPHLAVLV